jgi:hypothetical protein
MSHEGAVSFQRRELKGSRLRCLMLTSLADREVAAFLNGIAQPHAVVSVQDIWQPRGFLDGGEARLGEALSFLTADQRETLTNWWLKVRERANTPNWDVVSTCRVAGQPGLLVVEAKAHGAELHRDGKLPGNAENDIRIQNAISEANRALGGAPAGWHLRVDSHYQLCNRFAWGWKVASIGVPVVLVYLGFLDADEMGDGAFRSEEAWRSCLFAHAESVVPRDAWERRLPTGEAGFVPILRSARISAVSGQATLA